MPLCHETKSYVMSELLERSWSNSLLTSPKHDGRRQSGGRKRRKQMACYVSFGAWAVLFSMDVQGKNLLIHAKQQVFLSVVVKGHGILVFWLIASCIIWEVDLRLQCKGINFGRSEKRFIMGRGAERASACWNVPRLRPLFLIRVVWKWGHLNC
jgi:hypothetical protein